MRRPNLESFDWSAQVQPPSNTGGAIAEALRELATATRATGDASYSRLLYAVGNNHSGTYFPVVLAVIPFLEDVLEEGGPIARARSLDVLIDLVASFAPEPGFEVVETPSGPRPLRERLREEVAKLASTIARIASGEDSEESTLARDLLKAMRDD